METKFLETYKEFANLVLGGQLRDMTSTSVCNSLANLYTMDEHSNTFRYSKLSGILTLDFDRPLKTRFFRMYSMDSFELLFECELYYGFDENYRPISDNLWAFDFLEGIIMFEFTSMGEGQKMADSVKQNSMKMKEYNTLMEARKAEEEKKRKDGTLFGKMKNFFKGEEKVQESTKILSVKKENSIHFDPASGKFTNIPPQFVEQLAKLGLSKKDLEDKETAQIVMQEIIVFQAIKEAQADPTHTALRETIRDMKLDNFHLPEPPKLPPPPPTGLGLPPPPSMPKPPATIPGRGDLLKQIQKGNFKLKPVEVNKKDGGVSVDLSKMDKEERQDLSAHIKAALKKRSQALMRNQDSD